MRRKVNQSKLTQNSTDIIISSYYNCTPFVQKDVCYKKDLNQTFQDENYTSEMKTTLVKINSRLDIAEENFSEQEDIMIETIQN